MFGNASPRTRKQHLVTPRMPRLSRNSPEKVSESQRRARERGLRGIYDLQEEPARQIIAKTHSPPFKYIFPHPEVVVTAWPNRSEVATPVRAIPSYASIAQEHPVWGVRGTWS